LLDTAENSCQAQTLQLYFWSIKNKENFLYNTDS
jgi:hypothetical protein